MIYFDPYISNLGMFNPNYLHTYYEILTQYHVFSFLNPLLQTCNFHDCFWQHPIMTEEIQKTVETFLNN